MWGAKNLKPGIRNPSRRLTSIASNGGLFVLAMGFAIYCAIVLGRWLVDDAGISFAYARSLGVDGTLNPLRTPLPVEGYSNPLWVLLLALPARFWDVHSVLGTIPKLLFFVSLARLTFFWQPMPSCRALGPLCALLLALQPAVVIWSFSGLENALNLFLLCELIIALTKPDPNFIRHYVAIGLILALLALTRPEGILYSLIGFLLMVDKRGNDPSTKRSHRVLPLALPLATFVAYQIFRWMYFGELSPNTYLAKGGDEERRLLEVLFLDPHAVAKLGALFEAIFGWNLQTWGAIVSIICIARCYKSSATTVVSNVTPIALIAAISYLVLRGDWMAELRYATLFFPAFYAIFIASLAALCSRAVFSLFVFSLLSLHGWNAIDRISSFAQDPTIPLDEVRHRSNTFQRWGASVDIVKPTILTADVGGLLVEDDVAVIDLGMLCNRAIAAYLGEGSTQRDIHGFHDYIFNDVRPDLISTKAYHAYIAALDEDPRFREAYVPINESEDQWILSRFRKSMMSGYYIRRELVTRRNDQLEQMQRDAKILN